MSEFDYRQRPSSAYADGFDAIDWSAKGEPNSPPYIAVKWPVLGRSSPDPTDDEKLIKKLAGGLIEQADALGLCVEIWRDGDGEPWGYWVEVWPKAVGVGV